MSDTPDKPEEPKLRIIPPDLEAEETEPRSSNPIDEAMGAEARILLKSIRVPAEGMLPPELQESIRRVVRDHVKQHRLTYREVSRQVGYAESTLSEVLKGTYTRANNSPILRKLNGWVDDDERRRQRRRPLGFYPTSVFETIRALAQYAKSNARMPESQRNPVAENDPPRIALGYGPAGSGKTIGARALNAEDPLSIYIRIVQKSGTDAGIANLIIDAMGIRGAKRGKGAVRMVIEKLKDTGRLLIVDEAHRIGFSGLEFIRDLADVCGIPVLLLATEEVYARLTETRQRRGSMFYDQFSRRVCHVADLVKGLDGKGGIKRPVFSMAEIRAMFRSDQLKVTGDAHEYLQDIACTIGLGMLGLAATIFEKSYRAALRGRKILDAALLRSAARRVLIPAGNIDHETILRIDHTGEQNRRMAAG